MERKVKKITNFMDQCGNSLTKIQPIHGLYKEFNDLNKHLHSYSDRGKDLTSWDGQTILYGKVFTF